MKGSNKVFLIPAAIVGGFIGLVLLTNSIVQIDSGAVGVKLRNGAVVDTLGEGLKFKIPFIERVITYEVRTLKEEVLADSASRDLQQVDATVALNYRVNPDNADNLYRNIGLMYRERIVIPRLQESVKSVSARYTAEELIAKRAEVRNQILDVIKSKLEDDYFIVEDVNIVNLTFSREFNASIEEKQLAEQRAKKAENDLKRIQIEAEQQITKAQADAEAQRLQQQTLNDLLFQKQFIEKWNGVLPQVMGSDANILDLKSLRQTP